MHAITIYSFFLFVLFIIEMVYFRIADKYNIIDKPNHRSSHSEVTIRGGGIVFAIAALLWFLCFSFTFPYFILGLLLIAAISFLDDFSTLKSEIRFVFHLLAVGLLLHQADLVIPWICYPVLVILIIGTINAYNFMDGINGITGAYSMIALATLFSVNRFILLFISEELLVFILLSTIVFNYYNFRRKAKCFAGDVGSVSIAFIIVFFLIQLISLTHNLLFVGFLLVYGLDAVTTIVFRLIRRENIFVAHRSHLYQYLANERKWPHVQVSLLYAGLQGLINIVIICLYSYARDLYQSLWFLSAGIGITALAFVWIRLAFEGKNRLFNLS